VNTLKKSLLGASVALALGGAGIAPETQAIHLAEDGIGQVLLAPMYLAEYGYNTKITVVNTRPDVAVKAKIVFRSRKDSKEALDFILYLSPGDVWRGEVVRGEDGQAYLTSDDDSMKSSQGLGRNTAVFASEVPVNTMLRDHQLIAPDINEIGHIEVIGIYGIAAGTVVQVSDDPTDTITVFRTMSKQDLATIFDTSRADLTDFNGAEVAVVGRNENTGIPYGGSFENQIVAPSGDIRSTDPTWVNLSGFVEMNNVDTGDRVGYRMPALAGEVGDNVPPEGTFTYPNGGNVVPFDGRVISNPDFDATIADETRIGEGFMAYAYGKNSSSGDNIIEIEHALASTVMSSSYEDDSMTFVNEVASPGINRTQLMVTFPTKYRHYNDDPCGTGYNLIDRYSPPFYDLGDVVFNLTEYDNRENLFEIRVTPIGQMPIFSGDPEEEIVIVGLCDSTRSGSSRCLNNEVNYFLPSWTPTYKNSDGSVVGSNFESGWFEFDLFPRGGCSYNGVPALGFAHKYHQTDSGFSNSWFVPMTHKPELVNRQWPVFPASDAKNQ